MLKPHTSACKVHSCDCMFFHHARCLCLHQHILQELMEARDDDYIFGDYISVSSVCSSVVNEDTVHNKMPQSVRDYLKKRFGSIARFYSGIPVAEPSDVNGFSRIKDLRKALSALDRGGWERSYHQKLFHVSGVLF